MNREYPILFNGAMMRAVLDGSKTVTRRPVKSRKPIPADAQFAGLRARDAWFVSGQGLTDTYIPSPYGRPGDTLYVRETSRVTFNGNLREYRADYPTPAHEPGGPNWTPSILMPRTMCRQLLRNTSVRVERLSAIDDAGARAEGFASREAFIAGWHELYGAGDPWVWVIGFVKEEMLEALADMLPTAGEAADAIRAALAEIDRLEGKVSDLEDDVEQLRDELQAVEEAAVWGDE